MNEKDLMSSVEKCLVWIEKNMLTDGRGAHGIYERIRTDLCQRVELCRPDVASEYLRTLYLYRKTGRKEYDDVFENVTRWLEYAQNRKKEDKNTAFPFYLVNGKEKLPRSKTLLYQNDNGKVLLNLCYLYEKTGDTRYLTMAEKSADFWVKTQRRKGNFFKKITHLKRKDSYGPCFLLWLMAGLFSLGKITGKAEYTDAAKKAFSFVQKLIVNGRLRTSYEVSGAEAWRPASSENYIAMLCFILSYRFTGDRVFLEAIDRISAFCDGLIEPETGAVKNGFVPGASLNENGDLCDFVYTQGYAFLAMIEMYKVLGEEKYLFRAEKAAGFLMETQIDEGSPKTDGAWRGSYDVRTKKAEGNCDQNNPLNEGGKHSVYTGWCALPIATGLTELYLLYNQEDKNELL